MIKGKYKTSDNLYKIVYIYIDYIYIFVRNVCQKYNKRIRILQDITNMDILKLKLVLKHINTSIVDSIHKISTKSLIYIKSKEFSTGIQHRYKPSFVKQ